MLLAHIRSPRVVSKIKPVKTTAKFLQLFVAETRFFRNKPKRQQCFHTAVAMVHHADKSTATSARTGTARQLRPARPWRLQPVSAQTPRSLHLEHRASSRTLLGGPAAGTARFLFLRTGLASATDSASSRRRGTATMTLCCTRRPN